MLCSVCGGAGGREGSSTGKGDGAVAGEDFLYVTAETRGNRRAGLELGVSHPGTGSWLFGRRGVRKPQHDFQFC